MSAGRRPTRLWAKSPRRDGEVGEALDVHLETTGERTVDVARRVGANPVLGPDAEAFWRAVHAAAVLHDAGKATRSFQQMLGNPDFGARDPLEAEKRHERHEVLSLGFLETVDAASLDVDLVAAAVAVHHRAWHGRGRKKTLADLYGTGASIPERFADLEDADVRELAAWLAERLGGVADLDSWRAVEGARDVYARLYEQWALDAEDGEIPADVGLKAVLLQGALTTADHAASAHRRFADDLPLPEDYPSVMRDVGLTPRRYQEQSAEIAGHTTVVAPTGSGKTEAMLAWAGKQAALLAERDGSQPRVFYVLPYLASINAMVRRLESTLDAAGKVGVSHGKAAGALLAWAVEDGCDDPAQAARVARGRAAATRLFRERLRVATPYQLLRGVFAGPKHSSMLLDAAGSVFVFDELHALDEQRFGMVLAGMKLWEQLGGRIAVTSATFPQALRDLVAETLDGPVGHISHADPDARPRHRAHVRDTDLLAEENLADVEQQLQAGQAVLVIANTVARARDLFTHLAPAALRAHPEDADAALLLHSRFRARDRSRIEEALRARYATGGPRPGGLLVATQTVEVSLDVDFDALWTDPAPLDSLLQRMGRCNRVAARPPADVVVCAELRESSKPPGRQDGVYPLEPVSSAVELLRARAGEPFADADVDAAMQQMLDSDWGVGWRARVRQHRDEFFTYFCTYTQPFEDRSELEDDFAQQFDGGEVLLAADVEEFAELHRQDPLLAADLLIPVPYWVVGQATFLPELEVFALQASYSEVDGLGELGGGRPSHTETIL